MNESRVQDLASYVRVLTEAAEATSRAEDRQRYQRHLAEAGRLIPALLDDDQDALARWVNEVSESFGRDFLSGPEGDRAERAFVKLRASLGYPQ